MDEIMFFLIAHFNVKSLSNEGRLGFAFGISRVYGMDNGAIVISQPTEVLIGLCQDYHQINKS